MRRVDIIGINVSTPRAVDGGARVGCTHKQGATVTSNVRQRGLLAAPTWRARYISHWRRFYKVVSTVPETASGQLTSEAAGPGSPIAIGGLGLPEGRADFAT